MNNTLYLNELLYTKYFTGGVALLILWVAVTAVCAFYRQRELWWCWLLVSTATLPIAFTVVPRGGPSLYLPLFAWSLFIAAIVAQAFRSMALRSAVAALIAMLIAFHTISLWRQIAPAFLDDQRPVWSVITQLRDLGSPPPNTRVIFLKNPLVDWSTYFIARLTWRDRSIDIKLADKLDPQPTAADLDRFDWILTFENGNLRVLLKR